MDNGRKFKFINRFPKCNHSKGWNQIKNFCSVVNHFAVRSPKSYCKFSNFYRVNIALSNNTHLIKFSSPWKTKILSKRSLVRITTNFNLICFSFIYFLKGVVLIIKVDKGPFFLFQISYQVAKWIIDTFEMVRQHVLGVKF